jgi:hypothetical protein
MKNNFILFSLLISTWAFAQFSTSPQNEVRLNIANTIIIASVEVGYEYFVSDNQSLEAELHINDRFSYHSAKGNRDFNTNSMKIGYNYYFDSTESGHGIYANPFAKYRFGDFKQGENQEFVTDMNSFILGLGVGYKFNSNNRFIISPFISVARNFSKEVTDRFSAIEVNAGVNIGVRF